MRLLSVLDTPEGFRVLIQDPENTFTVYSARADAVFYRKCSMLYGAAYTDSVPPDSELKTPLFQVHDSTLISELHVKTDANTMMNEPLSHFALCFRTGERVDIVCSGTLTVRLAGAE